MVVYELQKYVKYLSPPRQDTTREVQFYLYVAQVACVLYICVHSVGAAWCTCCCRPADADRVLLINSGSSPEVAASTIFSSDTQVWEVLDIRIL